MPLWVIVPVKSIHNGKSRLAGVLTSMEREKLNSSMLTNLLNTLHKSNNFAGVMIISQDDSIDAMARRYGFDFLREQEPFSLNKALATACNACYEKGATEILILPADIPMINEESLRSILEKNTDPPVVVITPDRRKEGTNSLLINPVNGFTFQFGDNSFVLHQQSALEKDYRVEVVYDPEIELDLDLPEDWDFFQSLIHEQIKQNGG